MTGITSELGDWAEGYATSLNHLAFTYYKLGRPNEALPLEQEALTIRREGYESSPERWAEAYASSLNNLACTLEATQDLSRALELWQEAKKLTSDLSPLPSESKMSLRMESMIMSARLLRMLKRYPEAFSELDAGEALVAEMDHVAHPERHSLRAWSLIVRAATSIQTCDVAAAKALVPKAEKLIRAHDLESLVDGLDSLREDLKSAEEPGM